MEKKWSIRWKREVEVFFFYLWRGALLQNQELVKFITSVRMSRSVHIATRRETGGCPPPPCSSSPTASSCLLHWFRHSSALKETQGRVEDSNLHRPFFLFFIFVSLPLLKPSFFSFFLNKRGKNWKEALTRFFCFVFFFRGKGLVREWRVLRVFFSLLSHLLPPPVKPSDNSGADRLAGNKKGSERWGRRVWLIFQERHKIPPTDSPSLCVSFLPPHKSIYNRPIYFLLLRHLSFEWNLIKQSLMGLWLRTGWTRCPRTVVSVNLSLSLFISDLFFSRRSSLIPPAAGSRSVWNSGTEWEEQKVTS